jgi:hypothetical protein
MGISEEIMLPDHAIGRRRNLFAKSLKSSESHCPLFTSLKFNFLTLELHYPATVAIA